MNMILDITSRAIEAAKSIGQEIVIKTEMDLTPSGKRRVEFVRYSMSGQKRALHIRWYVGQKGFRTLPLTNENIELSNNWKAG